MAGDRTNVPQGLRTTRRRGRTSEAKRTALEVLGPRWSIAAEGPWDATALETAFGGAGPLLVDVGVGDGAATLAWAQAHPEARAVAIEVHRPGLAKLLTALDDGGPTNVRVVEADALDVLAHLGHGTVATVRVLFPDPWPKRRHVARRMVDRAFAAAVADVLEDGGRLEVATDWDDYAEHARTMVAAERRLVATHPEARPDRPVTAYERRGREAGRTITDLAWVRRAR
ncbi:MAG: tRNA (guanosine(46)-N7)-methyltransferase TrmB [Acidimicrobiales bacterium]